MRSSLSLAAVLVLVATVALAADPGSKPAPKGGKPAASPEATPAPMKEPEKNECSGKAKDGSTYFAQVADYQACLRDITAQVKAKVCKDGDKEVEFTFVRGGKPPVATAVRCK